MISLTFQNKADRALASLPQIPCRTLSHIGSCVLQIRASEKSGAVQAEGTVTVFALIDHHTLECLGLQAASRTPASRRSSPSARACVASSGALPPTSPAVYSCATIHGPEYISDEFQAEIAFFGQESSPSFVRPHQGNGIAEWFMRPLKEQLLWVRDYHNLDELNMSLGAMERAIQ